MNLFLVLFVLSSLASPTEAHAGFFSDLLSIIIGKAEGAAPLESSSATLSLPLLGSGGSNGFEDRAVGVAVNETDETPLAAVEESALVATRNPQGTLSPSRDQIAVYIVQPGDTPAGIAKRFTISLQTLFWANDLNSASMIKVGDTLVILPVSGVKYQVRKGDTIEGIAKKFNGDVGDIMSFNGLVVGEPLEVGVAVIIPDGEVATPSNPSPRTTPRTRVAGLPEHRGYYMRPIIGGRRSRGLHGYNGVDLANTCSEPVLSSAEGTIIITRASGWNGGYGRYVVVAHPNGTQTLYAHLSSILGSVGQKIAQGSQIATIGSTGNSTGCHLHFEIRGAKNPF